MPPGILYICMIWGDVLELKNAIFSSIHPKFTQFILFTK